MFGVTLTSTTPDPQQYLITQIANVMLPPDRDNTGRWTLESIAELKDGMKEVRGSLSDINVTLAKQHVSLEDHIRRTLILEKRVDGMWLKVMSVVGGLMGIATAAIKLYELLHAVPR